MDKELKPYTHDELWKMYLDGESVDLEIFAEMRSNIRLVNGDHYNRKRFNINRIIQDADDLTEQQKIRITKNHIQKICRVYEDNVIAAAPGVGFSPHNESEVQDQKAAELHHAVWLDAEERCGFKEDEEGFVEDLIEIGEEIAKVFYDPTEGPIIGHYSKQDENGNDTGEPDLMRPVFKGGIVVEDIEGYNLLRPVECKKYRKAEWLGIRKMINVDLAKARFSDPEVQGYLNASADETYIVFDSFSGTFRKTDKECFMVEMYFRPSVRYPNGYYYFMTREGIVHEDELPGGIFPIIFQPCERIKGSMRGRSPIKTMRPFQVEINRCASKMAEHHTTVGDDKIILLNGAKATGGIASPGVRTVNVTGQPPTILPGRDGSQYLSAAQNNVSELYGVMGVAEDSADMQNGQADSTVLLFRSAKQKAIHNRRIRRHSNFKKNVVKTYLKLAKLYLSDDDVINAVGKNEQINISEFKNSSDACYEVNVDDQADDIETKLGKQMMYMQLLQYLGGKLSPDQIGMIIRLMPYSNGEMATSDLTSNFDRATNDILALDRGERPPVSQYDDHNYAIQRLTKRVGEPSFKFLNPQIQQNYHDKIDIHMQFDAYNKQVTLMSQKGLIPTTGYLVVCDLYVPKPDNPAATQRVKIPSDALQYLIKQLEIQGTMTQDLNQLPGGAQAQLAEKMLSQQGGHPQLPQQPQQTATQPIVA